MAADLKSLNSRAIRGEFARVIGESFSNEFIQSIAYVNLESDQYTEIYKFLGDTPKFREFLGERNRQKLSSYDITIPNKKFEVTLEVLGDDVENDRTKLVQDRIDGLATASPDHWRDLVLALINGGRANLAYDGQLFFDTDHPHGKGGASQAANDITVLLTDVPTASDLRGTVARPSAITFAFALLRSIEQFYTFKTENDRFWNAGAKEFKVLVPLNYSGAALSAVSQELLGTYQNPLLANNYKVSVEVAPELTLADSFVTLRTDAPGVSKPLILQQMNKIKYTKKDENSDHYHDTDTMEFGLKVRRGAGYGLWQHAVATKLQAS
jgi:phage major head subunit gpT-like protein